MLRPMAEHSRVRAARLETGLSQAALAEAAGLTRQALYAIESGRYLPNVARCSRPPARRWATRCAARR